MLVKYYSDCLKVGFILYEYVGIVQHLLLIPSLQAHVNYIHRRIIRLVTTSVGTTVLTKRFL
jgi:hypothetical protein